MNSRLRTLAIIGLVANLLAACSTPQQNSSLPKVELTFPSNKNANWDLNDYALCLNYSGGASHSELHLFIACMSSLGDLVVLRSQSGSVINVNSLHSDYYYPLETVQDFAQQFPPDTYAPAPAPQADSQNVQQASMSDPTSSSDSAVDPNWQRMFPNSLLNGGRERLSNAELRLFYLVRRHPVRLLKVAHPDATPEHSGVHVEPGNNGNSVIVDDFLWSQNGHYYGTTMRFTAFQTNGSTLDSVNVDVKEVNSPFPVAFFYSEVTKQVVITALLAEYAVPARIFRVMGPALSVQVGLGMVLCYAANNP